MSAEAATFHAIRRALDSSRLPVEVLRKRQEQGMRRLLAHAYDKAPIKRPDVVVGGAGTLHALAKAVLERGERHVPRLVFFRQ